MIILKARLYSTSLHVSCIEIINNVMIGACQPAKRCCCLSFYKFMANGKFVQCNKTFGHLFQSQGHRIRSSVFDIYINNTHYKCIIYIYISQKVERIRCPCVPSNVMTFRRNLSKLKLVFFLLWIHIFILQIRIFKMNFWNKI